MSRFLVSYCMGTIRLFNTDRKFFFLISGNTGNCKWSTPIDIYKNPGCPTSYTTHVKIRSGS